jgi:hypothetical protein
MASLTFLRFLTSSSYYDLDDVAKMIDYTRDGLVKRVKQALEYARDYTMTTTGRKNNYTITRRALWEIINHSPKATAKQLAEQIRTIESDALDLIAWRNEQRQRQEAHKLRIQAIRQAHPEHCIANDGHEETDDEGYHAREEPDEEPARSNDERDDGNEPDKEPDDDHTTTPEDDEPDEETDDDDDEPDDDEHHEESDDEPADDDDDDEHHEESDDEPADDDDDDEHDDEPDDDDDEHHDESDDDPDEEETDDDDDYDDGEHDDPDNDPDSDDHDEDPRARRTIPAIMAYSKNIT